VEMENSLAKNEKSARLKWKMRSLKLVKSALLNENMRSVKLINPISKNTLGKNGKSAQYK
jgi:hypothetical protein